MEVPGGHSAIVDTMTEAGHSDRTLAARLGLKDGSHAAVFGAPRAVIAQVRGECPGAKIESRPLAGVYLSRPSLFLWCFCETHAEIKRALPALRRILEDGGALWISFPRKSALEFFGIDPDKALTEDAVREQAKSLGLKEMKACAVDEAWSALGLMKGNPTRNQINDSSTS